jgi:hypothetical protein
VQNPEGPLVRLPTGRAEDCPQPDWGLAPLAEETDWQPAGVATATPKLNVETTGERGRVSWNGTAGWQAKEAVPTARSANVDDPTGDGTLPMTDLTGFTATVTPHAVQATLQMDQLWPTTNGGRVTGYGLYVGGRKFDSFVTTQGAGSEVQTIDSGARHVMPAGTSTWDTDKGTVTFTIPRSYLASQRITAPYAVYAATGVHIRTKDWVTSLDRAPAKGSIRLAAPAMAAAPKDAPMAKRSVTRTLQLAHDSGNTFTPEDTSTQGIPLVPVIGNVHRIALPIKEQATAAVTLTWDDPSSGLGLVVKGGSDRRWRAATARSPSPCRGRTATWQCR